MRGVAVLGSTGSIGESALAVLRRHPDRFRVVALTAGSNADRLKQQAEEFRPDYVGLVNGEQAHGRTDESSGRASVRLCVSASCLIDAATHPKADIVINAVVGFAGLDATLAALRAGKRVALANKESLVTAGPLVLEAARAGGGEIIPVDSEHSAVLQCLTGTSATPSRLVLTASGGPFRTWEPDRIAAATVNEALKHPTWRMGSKISVDSATLVNKALEIIEAHYLFGLPYDRLDVVVHPQSIVHAFVEFTDGSVLAQLGVPSMELPILYALTYPERVGDAGTRRFDPVTAGPLTFEPVRGEVFRGFQLGVEMGRKGGSAPTVFNAANEAAVAAFLDGRISFGRIGELIERVASDHEVVPVETVAAVRIADGWARARVRELLGE
jgi:1-deoxy-D-xylulose-5-phosphate reductoisomerase